MTSGPTVAPVQPDTAPSTSEAALVIERHIADLETPLAYLRTRAGHLDAWGRELFNRLSSGHKLLVAGNGGSAAEAQHLSAELVGRFDGERRAFSALALHADTSSVTAIGNDYGFDEVFARQVTAHARPRDVLLLLSTSGSSRNLLRAAEAARACGATTWAITGAAGNPLSRVVDDALTLPGVSASVQEAQLVAIHGVCRAFDHYCAQMTGLDELDEVVS